MASLLKPVSPKRILDIGCGEGSGLLALLSVLEPDTVVSLDENFECISTAERNITAKGYGVATVQRMDAEPIGNGQHQLGVEPGKLAERTGITLIESDVLLQDDELFSFLRNMPSFDAVTVWLMGSHFARRECANIAQLQIKSSGEYRLRVQNRVYELADQLLRPGGVLQVVDRGEVPRTEPLQNDFLAAHKEQASVTSLEVKSLEWFVYTEPTEPRKVAMVPTIGKSGRLPDMSQFAMTSVISVKP